jgi:hypothetical protein
MRGCSGWFQISSTGGAMVVGARTLWRLSDTRVACCEVGEDRVWLVAGRHDRAMRYIVELVPRSPSSVWGVAGFG